MSDPPPAGRVLRNRCNHLLCELQLPRPLDLPGLCRIVASRRNRQIVLEPVGDLQPVLGLWIATPAVDIIAYEAHTTELHQRHIVVHELSHMLLGHFACAERSKSVERLLPHLRTDLVRGVFHRAAYSDAEEREAEILASLLIERTLASHVPCAGPRDPNLARRLRNVLGSD